MTGPLSSWQLFCCSPEHGCVCVPARRQGHWLLKRECPLVAIRVPRHKRVAGKTGWLIIMTMWKLVAQCAAAGGQTDKACEVFEQMKYTGCRPDVVTYSALISAYSRSGQWHSAVRTFEQMQQHNCKPDSHVFQTVIDCLWQTGVAWAQARAWQLYVSAARNWQFRFTLQQANSSSSSPGELEYVVPAITPGVGLLALRKWVGDLVGQVESDSVLLGAGRERIVLSMGRSKHARESSSSSSAGQTLLAVLAGLKSPFR